MIQPIKNHRTRAGDTVVYINYLGLDYGRESATLIYEVASACRHPTKCQSDCTFSGNFYHLWRKSTTRALWPSSNWGRCNRYLGQARNDVNSEVARLQCAYPVFRCERRCIPQWAFYESYGSWMPSKALNDGGIIAHSCPFHGTISHGASHTTYSAGSLPDSEVFLRPPFLWKAVLRRFHTGFGTGSAYPQGRRHGVVHVTIPSPTYALVKRTVVFEAHNGVKTMANTAPRVQSHSPSGLMHGFDRSHIEHALNTALQYVKNAHDAASIQAATGKTIRAATLLKRACEAVREGGKV